jgi:hypothetical protein
MSERLAVQLSLRWGDVVLRTSRAHASRAFVLGEGGDWEMPEEVLGSPRFELLRARGGELVLAVPPRAHVWVSDARLAPFRPAPEHALRAGSRAHVELGALAVDLAVAPLEKPVRGRALPAMGWLLHQGLSTATHLGVLAMLALFVPRLGDDSVDAEELADRVQFILVALDDGAMRERDRLVPESDDDDEPAPGQGGDGQRGGGTGTRARGEEGAPGSSVTTARGGHVAVQGQKAEPDAHLAREAALREAATSGLIVGIEVVAASADPGAPASPWGRESSAAIDPSSARAPLWGDGIHDAFAWGGLGLSGTGEGGGGRAEAMGLGDVGAFGRGAGTGSNMSFGPGEGLGGAGEGGGGRGEGIGIGSIGSLGTCGAPPHGCTGSGQGFGGGRGGVHRVGAPRLRCAPVADGPSDCVAYGTGRLPPEAIRRVVQANSGRFRLCYERGLVRRPDLSGRVVTRFVIARDGGVAVAADGGSDLPDAAVVDCVVRAFGGLSFPEPAGGTVAVVYPIAFDPT